MGPSLLPFSFQGTVSSWYLLVPNLNVNSTRAGLLFCHHLVPSPLHKNWYTIDAQCHRPGKTDREWVWGAEVSEHRTGNHSFIQFLHSTAFIQRLPCARHCSGHGGVSTSDNVPVTLEATLPREDET